MSALIKRLHTLVTNNSYFQIVYLAKVATLVKRSTTQRARLAQSVEHETLNLRVVGSSPTLGAIIFFF